MYTEKKDLFFIYINNSNKIRGFKNFLRFFFHFFKNIIFDVLEALLNRRENKNIYFPNLVNSKLVFVNTINNFRALEFLFLYYPDALLTYFGGNLPPGKKGIDLNLYYSKKINFKKYIFLIYLLINPKYGTNKFSLILKTYEIESFYEELFINNKPKLILISNDHAPHSRGLLRVANKINVKSIYLQHANISHQFPPLISYLALLYGKHSEAIYNSIQGSKSYVELVGKPSMDNFKQDIIHKKSNYKIGIAFNSLDNVEEVLKLYNEIKIHLPHYSFILRPHPEERRVLKVNEVFLSDSKVESTELFLAKIDILISNNSSILFEAALMNVFPIVYPFSENSEIHDDYYGFIKNGLAVKVNEMNELIIIIENYYYNPLPQRFKAKFYDASVGSHFEFEVKDRVISIINKYL